MPQPIDVPISKLRKIIENAGTRAGLDESDITRLAKLSVGDLVVRGRMTLKQDDILCGCPATRAGFYNGVTGDWNNEPDGIGTFMSFYDRETSREYGRSFILRVTKDVVTEATGADGVKLKVGDCIVDSVYGKGKIAEVEGIDKVKVEWHPEASSKHYTWLAGKTLGHYTRDIRLDEGEKHAVVIVRGKGDGYIYAVRNATIMPNGDITTAAEGYIGLNANEFTKYNYGGSTWQASTYEVVAVNDN